jgi:hypothetical protein
MWWNMQSYIQAVTLQTLSLTHTLPTTASAKTIVMISTFGYVPTPVSANRQLLSATADGNQLFASLRTNGQFWLSDMGPAATAKAYVDGFWVQNTSAVGNIAVPMGTYNNKWCVWIFNDLTLGRADLNFFGFMNNSNEGTHLGTKVACIALYNQALTAEQMTSITQWGLKRFGGL